MESTANHDKVLRLLVDLKKIQEQVMQNTPINNQFLNREGDIQFGELQAAYQVFFQEYIVYRSSVANGYLLKKKAYLQKDLLSLIKQKEQLIEEQKIERRDSSLAGDEYEMHKRLTEQRAEGRAQLRLEESKYLAKKSPLIQTETSIITGDNNYTTKQKEILELDNQVTEEKGKFLQALSSLVSAAEDWKSKYVLSASQQGRLSFAGIIQENQVLSVNQEIFYINPGNEQFFGEMAISQSNMGKVKEGQQVLVKLKSYPFEEYGMIRGRVAYIADVPYKDSVYSSKVYFKIKNTSDLKKPIHLKQGMTADAEIITQDATILQRLSRSFFKIINNK